MPAPARSTRRRLLVATPPLADPNFDRTVVFVLEHDDSGALGVVLNRPSVPVEVPTLDGWLEHADPPAVVFRGGPVERDAVIALGWPVDAEGALAAGLVTVDLHADPVLAVTSLARLRLFNGYAGWSPGQLDDELQAGAWLVVDAELEDIFGNDPTDVWRAVLRRQGGRLAWLAGAPDDLAMN